MSNRYPTVPASWRAHAVMLGRWRMGECTDALTVGGRRLPPPRPRESAHRGF